MESTLLSSVPPRADPSSATIRTFIPLYRWTQTTNSSGRTWAVQMLRSTSYVRLTFRIHFSYIGGTLIYFTHTSVIHPTQIHITYVDMRYAYASHMLLIRWWYARLSLLKWSLTANQPHVLKSCAYKQFFEIFDTFLIRWVYTLECDSAWFRECREMYKVYQNGNA